MTRVRWYNRLAAWLYARLDWLMELAVPVWEAEAEADLDETWEDPRWADHQAEVEAAYHDGRADEARERDRLERF